MAPEKEKHMKGQRTRTPATKIPHLRKKLAKNKVLAKRVKKK